MAATIPIIDIVTTTEDTTTTVTGMETLVYSGAELGTDETVDREAVGAGERELGTAAEREHAKNNETRELTNTILV